MGVPGLWDVSLPSLLVVARIKTDINSYSGQLRLELHCRRWLEKLSIATRMEEEL